MQRSGMYSPESCVAVRQARGGRQPGERTPAADPSCPEVPTIEVGVSLPATRVIKVLEQLSEMVGLPATIRCDNGTELTSLAFIEWCENRNIKIAFINPGKPDQDAFIER